MTALGVSLSSRRMPFAFILAVFVYFLASALLTPAHAHALEGKFIGDVTVEEDDTFEEIHTAWGDVVVEGRVEGDVSSGFGDVEVRGPVGGDVEAGFGNVNVDAPVRGEVKVGFGDLHLSDDARVGGVSLGSGTLDSHPNAAVGAAQAAGMAPDLDEDSPLAAFSGIVGWGVMALGLAAAAVLLVVAAPGPLRASARSLELAPGRSLLVGAGSFPAMVVASVLLAFTGVGLLLLPLAWPAYFALVLFGMLVAVYFVGRKVVLATGRYRAGDALAAVVGAVLVSAAYRVPIFGGLILAALAALGTGAAVFALLARRRRPRAGYASYEEYLEARRDI